MLYHDSAKKSLELSKMYKDLHIPDNAELFEKLAEIQKAVGVSTLKEGMCMKRLLKTRMKYNSIEAEAIASYESALSKLRQDYSESAVKLQEKKDKLFNKGTLPSWELDDEELPEDFNPLNKIEA